MGQLLSEPVTIKLSDFSEDKRHYFGVSSMQGWRLSMEDAHSAVLDVVPESPRRIAWFAVFDGHGGNQSSLFERKSVIFIGDRVAKYAGERVYQIVTEQPAFEEQDYVKALQDGFVATDAALMAGIFSIF
jgi:protein phosphatase PTC2/3